MIINGIDDNEFVKGWWGLKNEGKDLLSSLNLPIGQIPFDTDEYLGNGDVTFSVNGQQHTLGYKRYDGLFEFSLLKCGKPKIIKLYREWNGEDLDMVRSLESFAVGEYTRYALSGKMPRIDNI